MTKEKKTKHKKTKKHAESMPQIVPEKTGTDAEMTKDSQEQAAPVSPSIEEIQSLQASLEDAQAEAAEHLDGKLRALADFANYKKRIAREQETLHLQVVGRVIKRYLEVLDDLDRALQNAPTEGDGVEWVQGVELVARKMHALLEAEGVKPMEAQGTQFNPNLHEAISHEENDAFESGQIIEVVQQGYLIGDRILRPALVRVAK